MSESLKDGLDNVMAVTAVEIGYMQVHAAVNGKRIEKIVQHFRFKITDPLCPHGHIADQIRTAAQINNNPGQRLVHRTIKHTVAANARPVPQRLG